jgi:hypothetical protein
VLRDLRHAKLDKKLRKTEVSKKHRSVERVKQQSKAASRLAMRQGRLTEVRKKSYVNHLGDRSAVLNERAAPQAGSLEQQVASERVERLFSAFEELLIARFEEGKKVAQESADGKSHFLEKTKAEWKDFFTRFLGRTMKKKVLLSEIREFVYRGVVQKGNKGIAVADMALTNGKIEKFVRFSVLAEALAKLKAMVPGETFEKGMLEGLSGEELVFLALSVSRGQEMALAQQATQGKFIGGQAEARAAAELGIALEGQLQAKSKMLQKKAGGGLFSLGGFGDKEHYEDKQRTQFIPWWRWGRLLKSRKSKFTTVAFYLALLIISAIGVAVLSSRLLP